MPNGTERVLAEVLAGVVEVDHVPPDSHFFEDLCANSLVMAHGEVRQGVGLLVAKNRFHLRSMGLFLGVRWLHWFALTVIGFAAIDLYPRVGAFLIGVSLMAALLFSHFWWHERLWKVPDNHLVVLNGTPFKNVVRRLLGVRVGRRVFDDGASVTERTLASIGDDCTLGTGALVHYGVSMGDGAVLAPGSFLMKGEEVPSRAHWGGNPAVGR